jgi:hypothetical protein
MEQHEQAIRTQFHLDTHEFDVRNFLRECIASNLLISEPSLVGCPSGKTATCENRTIDNLGFITRNRPEKLRACLTSHAFSSRSQGKRLQYIVADDSDDEQAIAANISSIRHIHDYFGVRCCYVGRQQRDLLQAALRDARCASKDSISFALNGVDGYGNTTGANRNALLLYTVGTRVLSVDDDTSHDLFDIPETSEDLDIGHHQAPFVTWYFESRQSALASGHKSNESLVTAHEKLLGNRIHDIISHWNAVKNVRFASACPHVLEALQQGAGRVVLTFSGVLGDSGTYATGWPLDDRSGTCERLLASSKDYEVAASSREVLRGVQKTVICHGGPFIGLTIGIDNCGGAPPFFPVLRNQDGTLGATLLACEPTGFFGHLPIAVLHSADTMRGYAVRRESAILNTRFNDLLSSLILESVNTTGDLRANLRKLGAHLEAIGGLQCGDFRQMVTIALMRRLSQWSGNLHSSLQRATVKPHFWIADVEAAMENAKQSILTGEFLQLKDLGPGSPAVVMERAQKLIGRFGRLLAEWFAIVDCSRELRERETFRCAEIEYVDR